MFKPVINVICDDYEFLSSLISNCYPIPRLTRKFESLVVSLQCVTLLVIFKQKIVERKKFFTLIDVSTCPQILEWSSLFVKEMDMLYLAQFQTQTCSETARVVLCPQKTFFLFIDLA